MNKYEKQFEQLIAGTLSDKDYDSECNIEKCMGCSAGTCPFKQKIKEEYMLNLMLENMCSTDEEKEILRNAIKNKEPEALELLNQFIELSKSKIQL